MSTSRSPGTPRFEPYAFIDPVTGHELVMIDRPVVVLPTKCKRFKCADVAEMKRLTWHFLHHGLFVQVDFETDLVVDLTEALSGGPAPSALDGYLPRRRKTDEAA